RFYIISHGRIGVIIHNADQQTISGVELGLLGEWHDVGSIGPGRQVLTWIAPHGGGGGIDLGDRGTNKERTQHQLCYGEGDFTGRLGGWIDGQGVRRTQNRVELTFLWW